MSNNKFINWLVFAILVIYVVSPADFLPGPVDDVIAILLYLAANKRDLRLGKKKTDVEVLDVDGREI